MSYTPEPPEWPPAPRRAPIGVLGIVTAVLVAMCGLIVVGFFIAVAFSIGQFGTKG
ncbi:MAG: hypothetical protein QOJ69_1034 [Actinomycetota bacterium]|jgi:hypothetical protein|nr:hypothetical protein [Actinomycetota bacterium]MEA2843363.1 hypothetical protein [Actinomycetota bacterium]